MLEAFDFLNQKLATIPKILEKLEEELEKTKDFNKEFTDKSLDLLKNYILALLICEDIRSIAWFNTFQSCIAREDKSEQYDLVKRSFLTAVLILQGFKNYEWPKECKTVKILCDYTAPFLLCNPLAFFETETLEQFNLADETLARVVLSLANENPVLGFLAYKKAHNLVNSSNLQDFDLSTLQTWIMENTDFFTKESLENIYNAFLKTSLTDEETALIAHDLGIVCLIKGVKELSENFLNTALQARLNLYGEGSEEVNLTSQALEELRSQDFESSSAESRNDNLSDDVAFLKLILSKLDANLIDEAKCLIHERLNKR